MSSSSASISTSSSNSLLLPPPYKAPAPQKDYAKALDSLQSSIGFGRGTPRLPFQDITSNTPTPKPAKAPKTPKPAKPVSEKLKGISESAKTFAMLVDKYGAGGQGRMGRL